MKDETMTNQEIDEQVALELGWHRDPQYGWQHHNLAAVPLRYTERVNDGDVPVHPTTDARDCMPLLEQMSYTVEIARTVDDRFSVYFYPEDADHAISVIGDTVMQAICLAWLQWREMS